MIGDPTSNILDCIEKTFQMSSIQRIWESHVTTYLLDSTDEWEASAARRVLTPAVACLRNLPPYQGNSFYAFVCTVGGLIILSMAAALLLPNDSEVPPLDLAARLKAVRVKIFWGNEGTSISGKHVGSSPWRYGWGHNDRAVRRSYWEDECTLS
jgi:hypothetical protein